MYVLRPLAPSLLMLFINAVQLCTSTAAVAQKKTLHRKLCGTWQVHQLSSPQQPLNDDSFVLILNADSSVRQGFLPDALINGTWTVNEKRRLLTIRDAMTGLLYTLRVVSLTDSSLVLQQLNPYDLTIHYRRLR
ncbi:MAG: hypothetical protein NZL95_09530 [Chitinophagales bacterium]|nr:hypothetical protein [Chitinophagales bacterium]MDW8428774.1 hypothetical protein [Chitinophagales bacterium]